MRRVQFAFGLIAVMVALGAGCSVSPTSSSTSESPPESPPGVLTDVTGVEEPAPAETVAETWDALFPSEKEALTEAVIEVNEALLSGDGVGAYDLLSEHCRAVNDRDEFISRIEEFPILLEESGEPAPVLRAVVVLEGGLTGAAEFKSSDGSIFDQQWVYEDGRWRYDGGC